MSKNFTFHLVRNSSTRLKNKSLIHLGQYKVIEHSILRARYYGLNPIICTSKNKTDDVYDSIGKKYKINVFRGSLNNKLKRIKDCSKYFKIDYFHTVDVDDPFFDPVQIKKSLKLLKDQNYDIVLPSSLSSSGLASEGMSFNSKSLQDKIDTRYTNNIEMIDKYLHISKSIKSCKLPSHYYYKIKARLTLDYIEDYTFLNALCSIAGNFANRKKIEKIINMNTDLAKINLFRNKHWKNRQNIIIKNETKNVI